MTLAPLLLALALAPQAGTDPRADLPLAMALDDSAPRTGQDPKEEPIPRPDQPPSASKSTPVVDLDWLELTSGIGFTVFSKDYRTNPAPAFLLSARAPLPWLSPGGDAKGEYFGLFLEAAFTTIDRDLSSSVEHRRGIASFTTLGMDFSILRDGFWIVMARGGLLYAYYGNIADLSSGFGGTAGLVGGIQIGGKMALSYSPELLFGKSGSLIFLNTVGFSFQF